MQAIHLSACAMIAMEFHLRRRFDFLCANKMYSLDGVEILAPGIRQIKLKILTVLSATGSDCTRFSPTLQSSTDEGMA